MNVLNDSRIQKIRDAIVKAINPEKIILFGSYALYGAEKANDIDIAVISSDLKELNTHKRALTIQRLFRHRDFGLDVVVYSPDEFQMNSKVIGAFANIIEKEGVVLWEK